MLDIICDSIERSGEHGTFSLHNIAKAYYPPQLVDRSDLVLVKTTNAIIFELLYTFTASRFKSICSLTQVHLGVGDA